MNRRSFLQHTLATAALAAAAPRVGWAAPPKRQLTAYYLRAHSYTCVPRHIREDLQWMRDVGSTGVAITLLEQDIEHAARNLDHIFAAAQQLGMQVMLVPSRWGALIAGAPKVPSAYACSHFDTLVRKQDGSYYTNTTFGPMCSVYHPATFEFFCTTLESIFKQWPFAQVKWDEVKAYHVPDYSPSAQAALQGAGDRTVAHYQAVSDFFGRVNAYIHSKWPAVHTLLTVYANAEAPILESASQIAHLDYFGVDGRPWPADAGGQDEQPGKVLYGQPGLRAIRAARQAGKKTLALIENHNMRTSDYALLDKYLAAVLQMDYDHLLYYYYPRNLEQPEAQMRIMAKHLTAYAAK